MMPSTPGPSSLTPSNHHCFNNEALLSNIRFTPHIVLAITNGGYQDSNMVGNFPKFGPVYYNKASIANILSFAKVVQMVCRARYYGYLTILFC